MEVCTDVLDLVTGYTRWRQVVWLVSGFSGLRHAGVIIGRDADDRPQFGVLPSKSSDVFVLRPMLRPGARTSLLSRMHEHMWLSGH